VVIWLVMALSVTGVAGLGWLVHEVRTPYKGYQGSSVLVTIPPRSSTAVILKTLEDCGALKDARLGLLVLKLLHRHRTLKAGEYRFAGPRSAEQVILTLIAGDVVTYRVTVPEGLTAAETFALFSSQGFGEPDQFQTLFRRPDLFEGIPAGALTLEGFLFPDTYTVTRTMSAREIAGMMARQFARRLPRDFAKRAAALGLDALKAVTLASIVEKETALEAERPIVAAVYRNRLSRGMLLQCDPTTIYALKRMGTWTGTLTRTDLNVDDPYNTYLKPGLPPGPISSPGLSALRAAVDGTQVPYLYFVATGIGDGSHRFSAAYEEQQRNVVLYRQERKEARSQ